MVSASANEHEGYEYTEISNKEMMRSNDQNTVPVVGCLRAAVKGCKATLADVTLELQHSTDAFVGCDTKKAYDHMMIMRSHDEEKRENPCEELRCQSPKGLYMLAERVTIHGITKRGGDVRGVLDEANEEGAKSQHEQEYRTHPYPSHWDRCEMCSRPTKGAKCEGCGMRICVRCTRIGGS